MSAITGTITENQLRAFQLCPKYVSFGGKDVFPDQVNLLKLTTEKAIAETIRNNQLDPTMKYMKHLLRSSKELQLNARYLEGQLRELESKTGILLGELFNNFEAHNFLPVFGPAPWRVKVSKSVIELSISGILLENNGAAIHVIDFSPYQNLHGLRSDPITKLKAQTLLSFVRPWFNENATATLHTFSISEKDKLLYLQSKPDKVKQESLRQIQRTVRGLEMGLDFPVLPCNRACTFKSRCGLE